MISYGRWSLTRIDTQGVSFEKKTGHIYFEEENLLHAISKSRYVQFYVVVVPTTRGQKTHQVVSYKRLITMQNHSTVSPNKWSRALTGEIPTVRLKLGGFWCFG